MNREESNAGREPPEIKDSVDLTPESGSATDVARLGRSGAAPAHEQTASSNADAAAFEKIAKDPEFKALLRAKRRFIVPATIFFVLYYFALPILVGFYPELMKTRIVGRVNAAYLFALSQFFAAWALAWAYTRAAAGWDRMTTQLLRKLSGVKA